jgi:NAD(P)-dependent dehydrogenase (short-subunit alcohol dehydrogenase family)
MSTPSNDSDSPPAVALVTGASRGLGRGIAQVLARDGLSVAVHYASNKAAAEETLAACRQVAPNPAQKFIAVGGNVGVPADRAAIFQQTLEGLGRIDALVNNAGIAPRIRADITEATEEIFDEVMAVNLKGPLLPVASWWCATGWPAPRRAMRGCAPATS